MDNKKISITVGMIVIIILITVGVLMWTYENRKSEPVQQSQITNGVQQKEASSQNTELITDEPVEEWKIYQDDKYRFKFKYPQRIEVKIDKSYPGTDYYSIINTTSSEQVASFFIKKWKGYIVQENTPGTFWEKLSQANWKYFSNGIESIPSKECDSETLRHVSGLIVAENPKYCNVYNNENSIKVETENNIIFFTKSIEMRWDIKNNNSELINKLTSTLIIN